MKSRMKDVLKGIRKDGSGIVTLEPEDPEDMWHCYNLIRRNDKLTATTARKVVRTALTGTTFSERMITKLTIEVDKVHFDSKASHLKVNGNIRVENAFAPLGSFHSLDLELKREFVLEKGEDGWDSVAISILEKAMTASSRAKTFVVLMVPGEANIHRITENRTIPERFIKKSLPGKGSASAEQDKALVSFHTTLLLELLRLQDVESPTAPASAIDAIAPLVVASPAFAANNFHTFIKTYAHEKSHRPAAALHAKTVVAHASSAAASSLAEVIKSPALQSQLADARFLRETRLVDKLYTALRREDGRAWYGPKEVQRCVELGAVGRGGGALLLVNSLFRSDDLDERKLWVALVDKVQLVDGGEVAVLSEDHESGRRLATLGGAAALLTWAIEDIDVDDDEEGDIVG